MPENTLTYWMTATGKRANELGIPLEVADIRKAAKQMLKIAACDRIPDIDVIIRFHADPTYEEAVRNLDDDHAYQRRLTNRNNAARRLGLVAA